MALIFGMILDALMGEPRALWSRWPHPAVLMGRAVGWCDGRFNTGVNRRAPAVAVLAGLVAAAGLLGLIFAALPGGVVDLLVIAALLAQRSLVDHVRAVADALDLSVGDGRASVAMIVGRDTSAMDGPAVARAAIESAAENLSDGVVAPVFWFAVAGLPGLLIYKVANTADSMIGYRNDRYRDFGWAAARFDDLLNLIPARLTALLIWLTGAMQGGGRGQWPAIIADARRHRSPNAGWPEAAMARRLDTALSGPRSYDGAVQDYPFVHAAGRRDATAAHIRAAVAVLWQSWALLLSMAFVLVLLQG